MDFQQLTPEAVTAFLVLAYLVGVSVRVIWPYALAYFQDGTPFNGRMIVGQILAALIGLLGIIAADDFVASLGLIGFFGSFVAGFGAASVGRNTQKTVDAVRARGQ